MICNKNYSYNDSSFIVYQINNFHKNYPCNLCNLLNLFQEISCHNLYNNCRTNNIFDYLLICFHLIQLVLQISHILLNPLYNQYSYDLRLSVNIKCIFLIKLLSNFNNDKSFHKYLFSYTPNNNIFQFCILIYELVKILLHKLCF